VAQDTQSIKPYQQGNGNGETHDLVWDATEFDALAAVDYVWFVEVTDGRGHSLRRSGRREATAAASVAIDTAMHAMSQCGAHLQIGDLGVSAQIFSGGLLVTSRFQNSATLVALASPQANLGQVLNHVRRIGATFKREVVTQ